MCYLYYTLYLIHCRGAGEDGSTVKHFTWGSGSGRCRGTGRGEVDVQNQYQCRDVIGKERKAGRVWASASVSTSLSRRKQEVDRTFFNQAQIQHISATSNRNKISK